MLCDKLNFQPCACESRVFFLQILTEDEMKCDPEERNCQVCNDHSTNATMSVCKCTVAAPATLRWGIKCFCVCKLSVLSSVQTPMYVYEERCPTCSGTGAAEARGRQRRLGACPMCGGIGAALLSACLHLHLPDNTASHRVSVSSVPAGR